MRRKGIFVCSSGVRWQNGHWQKSGRGMKSYIWQDPDALNAVLPIVKQLTWNPLQQLNVSGSFDIDVKTFFDTVDGMGRPITSALFGISTAGRQRTQLSDSGFQYDQTIGAKGFNRKETLYKELTPSLPNETKRTEEGSIEISLRGYCPRSATVSDYLPVVRHVKTTYMVNNNVGPSLRYYIKYKRYIYHYFVVNGTGSSTREVLAEEEFETLIPLTITTTQQPFVEREGFTTSYYPIGDVLCMGHNEAHAHITYSFTIPAFDAVSYPHIANDLLSGNEYDFLVCLATGFITSSDEDWGSKVQLNISNNL